jgi:hypothetical protein
MIHLLQMSFKIYLYMPFKIDLNLLERFLFTQQGYDTNIQILVRNLYLFEPYDSWIHVNKNNILLQHD